MDVWGENWGPHACTEALYPLYHLPSSTFFFGLDLCSSRILWPYRLCGLLAFQSGMPTGCTYFLGARSKRCMCEQPCSMRRPARCQRLFPQWYTEVARLARGFRGLEWQSQGTDPEAGTAELTLLFCDCSWGRWGKTQSDSLRVIWAASPHSDHITFYDACMIHRSSLSQRVSHGCASLGEGPPFE